MEKVTDGLIAELLQFGRSQPWPEIAERHGIANGDAAQKRWARWARVNGYETAIGDSPPRKIARLPTEFDPSKYELTSYRTDGGDNIQSKRFALPKSPNPLPDFSGLELQGITTNPNGGAWLKMAAPNKKGFDLQELKSILANVAQIPIAKKDWENKPRTGVIQVASLGDIHIGMDSRDNVFNHEWQPEKAIERASQIGAHIDPLAAKVFLIFGGDLNDGQDGKTTRKGHDLPQNLGSREQIETSVRFCLACLDSVAAATNAPIEVAFISDSNHGGGVMDYAVGLLLQYLCPHRYSGQVDFKLQESFIETYRVGELDFLVTHGYDEKFMPRGLPRFLSKDNVTFFERVIEHRKLTNPVLWRFDQHQYHVIEYPKFTDLMTKAFSTPSSWVSLNFAAHDPGGFVLAKVDGRRLSVESVGFQ